jgi:hypothetical protein
MKARKMSHLVGLGLWMLLAGVYAMPSAFAHTETHPPRVTVKYDHPQKFTESVKSRAFTGSADNDDYLPRLKRYIQTRAAKILAPGERLDIVITDIDRAGNYEPWLGPSYSRVRIIRDVYPPRIDLHFRLLGADGQVIREGTRKLRDPGFLHTGAPGPGDSDSLRFEKRLIDRWLRRGTASL